nr:hypothetical protein [Tessaracoccus bendigoensis]
MFKRLKLLGKVASHMPAPEQPAEQREERAEAMQADDHPRNLGFSRR